jgi:hypothetical protein
VSGQGDDPKLAPAWRDNNGLLRQLGDRQVKVKVLLSRRAYLSQVLHYSRLRIQLLCELPVPDARTKTHLARPNRRYSTRTEAYMANILRIFALPLFLATAFIFVLLVSELVLIFHPNSGEAVGVLGALLVLFIALRRILNRVGNEFDLRQRIASLSLIPIGLGFVVGASIFVVGVLLESIWKNTASQVQAIKFIGTSFLQAAVLLPTFVVGTLLAVSIFSYLETLIRRARVPDLGIIAELQILLAMSLDGSRWLDFRHKRELLRSLEVVADCIEEGLPKRLRSGDVATDNWHREQARQMAASFRQLKRLVVSPGFESRAQFIQQIVDSYCHAVRGEWGLLERREPEAVTRPQRIARIAAIVRSLVVGVLPFSLVVLVQQSSMAIEGSVANYLKAGAILWGLVTILGLLDSNYAAKVSAVKDLAGLLTTKNSDNSTTQ